MAESKLKVKKIYLSRIEMAEAISISTGLTVADLRSRFAKMKLKPNYTSIIIEGQEHNLKYFKTPDKFL